MYTNIKGSIQNEKKVLLGTTLLLGFGISKQTAEATKQGAYISDGSMVQITKKNYDIWQNCGWQYKNNTTNIYQKIFKLKGVTSILMD